MFVPVCLQPASRLQGFLSAELILPGVQHAVLLLIAPEHFPRRAKPESVGLVIATDDRRPGRNKPRLRTVGQSQRLVSQEECWNTTTPTISAHLRIEIRQPVVAWKRVSAVSDDSSDLAALLS